MSTDNIKVLSEPLLRRAELLDLLSIERGLFIGWAERGLFKYTGPDMHRRLYSLADYLRLGIARRANQNGVQAAHVWSLLNEQPNVVLGYVRYAVSELTGADSPARWRLVPARLLTGVVEQRITAGGWVHTLVVVDLFAILHDALRRFVGYYERGGEDLDEDLKKALDTIAARVEPDLKGAP